MKPILTSALLSTALAGGVVIGKVTNASPVSTIESVCVGSDGSSTVEVHTQLGKMGHTTFVRDDGKCTKLSPTVCKAIAVTMEATRQWASSQDFSK